MPATLPGAPPAIVAALDRLKTELARAVVGNLTGLVLYGSLARGRYKPGLSDVNVAVVLREADAQALAAIAPALRAARRSAAVRPMILIADEIPAATRAFPIQFLDIKDHHVVLHGGDDFARLDVPRDLILSRLVQQFRNRAIRLRRQFAAVADDPEMQVATLAGLVRPLAVPVSALLRLAGKHVPPDDRTSEVFHEAAAAFGLDGGMLAELAHPRQDGKLKGEPVALFDKLFRCLDQLTQRAEAMKEGGR